MVDRTIGVALTADVTGLQSGLSAGSSAAQQFAAQTDAAFGRASASSARMSSAAAQVTHAIDGVSLANRANSAAAQRFVSDLERQVAGIGKTKAQLLELQAAQLGVSARAAPLISALSATQSAAVGVGMSAKQTANAMRLIPMQMTDIVTQLAGGQNPLLILTQQGGQLKDVFGGVGPALRGVGTYVMGLVNPFTLAAAAAAALAVAYEMGSLESERYSESLTLTGGFAGKTSGQIADMARNIGNTVGTTGQAADALNQIVATGKLTGSAIEGIGLAAVAMNEATGKAVKDTVVEFVKLGESPSKAIVDLNDQYHFLTASVYDQIKALEDQGDKQGAAALAQKTYSDALTTRSAEVMSNLGLMERGWNTLARAAKGAWDAALDIGRPETPQEVADKLKSIQGRIKSGNFAGSTASARSSNSVLPVSGDVGSADTLDQLRAEEGRLERLQATQRTAENVAAALAAADSREAASIKAGRDWDEIHTQNLTKQQALTKKIADIEKAGLAAGKSRDEINKEIKAARAKSEGATSTAGDSNIARLKARLVEEQAVSAELAHQGGQTTKLNEYEREALVIGEKLKGNLSAKVRASLEYQKSLAEQDGAVRRANDETRAFNAEREKEFQNQRNTTAKVEEQTQALQDQIDTYGMGKSAVEEMTIARLEEQAAALSLYGDNAKELVEGINAEIAARKNLTAAMASKDALDAQKKFADQMERQNEQIGQSLTDALLRGFESGKDFAENFADTLKNMFATLVLKPIIQPIVTSMAGAVTGALGFGSAAAAQGTGASAASSATSLAQYGQAAYSFVTGGMNVASLAGDKIYAMAAKAGSAMGLNFANGLSSTSSMQAAMAAAQQGGANLAGLVVGSIGNAFTGYGLSKLISGKFQLGGDNVINYIAAAASMIPGVGPIAGVIGGLINRAFGMAPKEYGATSIVGSLGGAIGFNGNMQTPWEQEGGWFRSSDSGVHVDVMGTAQSQAIGGAFNLIKTGVAALATSVGTSADSLINYSEQIKITLTDDAAANQKLIDDTLSGVGERMITTLIPAIGQFSKSGETVMQTLQRLGTSLSAVNASLAVVHKNLLDISLSGADAASHLADLFGGVDNFAQASQAFYQAAFTDAERAKQAMQGMQTALQAVGVSMPDTMVQLRDMAFAMDLTTDSGRAAYAALISVAPTFAQASAALLQAAKDAGAKLAAAYTGSGGLVAALDAGTLKTLTLAQTLVSTYSVAGSISTLFLDLDSGLITFGSGAQDLSGTLTTTQQAGLMLSQQMAQLRLNAGGAVVDFQGLNAALANVDTDTFVAAVVTAFQTLADRIRGVIGDINTERQAIRDAALQIIDPAIMTPAAIARQIAGINTTLPGNQAVVAAGNQLTAADGLAAQRKAQEQAAGNAYNPALAAFNSAASQVGGLQSQYDSLAGVIAGKEAEIAQPRKYSEGRKYVRDLQATMPALYDQLGQLSAALTAAKNASSGAQWNQVVALQTQYADAVAQSSSAQTAANIAAANAKLANTQYADALQAFAIDAGKSVDKLTNLREETVKYYEAQKQLADLMTASAAGLRKTTADYRLSQLSPEQQFASMQTDFAKNYAMALSTDGQTLAGYGDKLNAALGPMLDKAKDVLGGSQLDSFIATSLARADAIAQRLDTLAPSDYEANSLDLLGQIDATLAALDDSAQSASSIIANAINAGRDATVNGLRQITNALTGQSVAAFATGGDFSGGLRVVGERGPELEATGPSRIFNASQTRSILGGGGNNAELVTEIKALRAEVANLRIEARATATNTGRLARQGDRAELDGVLVRTDADTPIHTVTA